MFRFANTWVSRNDPNTATHVWPWLSNNSNNLWLPQTAQQTPSVPCRLVNNLLCGAVLKIKTFGVQARLRRSFSLSGACRSIINGTSMLNKECSLVRPALVLLSLRQPTQSSFVPVSLIRRCQWGRTHGGKIKLTVSQKWQLFFILPQCRLNPIAGQLVNSSN